MMVTHAPIAFLLAMVVAWGVTRWHIRAAASRRLLDVPGERSSHVLPTPTAGGTGIAAGIVVALLAMRLMWGLDSGWFLLLGCAVSCAVLGYRDDRHGVSIGVRLLIEAMLATAFLISLELPVFAGAMRLPAIVLAGICLVWMTNLFNFMDGIDGLAASQAGFLALGTVLIALLTGHGDGGSLALVAVAGACAGFLFWNRAPARVFMGDTGSLMLGFLLAGAALLCLERSSVPLSASLILWGAFAVDATLTLMRRLLRGDPVMRAHREHAYQRLSRRWGSHDRVVVAFQAVNLAWLLPLGLLAALRPQYAVAAVVLAWLPLAFVHTWAWNDPLPRGGGEPSGPGDDYNDRGL